MVLSATMRANTVALALRSRRAAVKSYAMSVALASSNAAPLITMMIATIFFGIDSLRKEIMVSPLVDAAAQYPPRVAISS